MTTTHTLTAFVFIGTMVQFVEVHTRLTPQLGNLLLRTHAAETFKGRLHNVQRIVASILLGEDVLNTEAFKNRTTRSTGNNTCTRRSRDQFHFGSPGNTDDFVGNGGSLGLDSYQVGTGVLEGFLQSALHFLGLAETDADLALFVTKDDKGTE